jgi:UDP-N-acetylmuramyl pentapeptide phosphotransferase/UDP-N-acetylglucosamine-1-phosphate transferase
MSAAIACLVSLLLMPLAVRVGRVTGLVDRPASSDLKIHSVPVSVLGGPAAIASAMVGLAVTGELEVGLAAGVIVAVATGLLDDARPLPPWSRLLMVGVAGAIVGQAVDGMPGPVATFSIMFLLGLACANAVNIVDGQDGLAGGLSAVASLSLGVSAHILGVPSGLSLGLAMGGSLLVFLIWNAPPASLFLGNGGAYGVGIVLAAQATGLVTVGPQGVIAAGIGLGFFAFELAATTIRRFASRGSLLTGDRRHSYDLLAARLGSRPRSTMALLAIGAACGGLGILAAAAPLAGAVAVAGVFLLVAGLAGWVFLRAADPMRDRPAHRHTILDREGDR